MEKLVKQPITGSIAKEPITRREFLANGAKTVLGLGAATIFSKFLGACDSPTSVEKLIETATFYKDIPASLGLFRLTLRSVQVSSTAKRKKSATIDLLKNDGGVDRTLILELNDSIILDDPANIAARDKFKIVCTKLPDFDSSTETVGLTLYSYRELS